MKLWLLRPRKKWETDLAKDNPWHPWYDKCFGLVVRAETEQSAREIAAQDSNGCENAKAWLEDVFSTCVVLSEAGEAGVIIQDIAQA